MLGQRALLTRKRGAQEDVDLETPGQDKDMGEIPFKVIPSLYRTCQSLCMYATVWVS